MLYFALFMKDSDWACRNVLVALVELLDFLLSTFIFASEVFNVQEKWANDASDVVCNVFFLFYV